MTVLIVVSVVMFAFAIICGISTAAIAVQRFRSAGYFFIGFFGGLIGLIIVAVVLTDNRERLSLLGITKQVYMDDGSELNNRHLNGEIVYVRNGEVLPEDEVRRMMREFNQHGIVPQKFAPKNNMSAHLREIHKLHTDGIINSTEYEKLKSKVIGKHS